MNLTKKSTLAALLLAILLGPLGYVYASGKGGLVLTVIALLGSPTVIIPVICWLAAIVMAPFAVSKHNRNVDATISLFGGVKKCQ